MIATTRLVLRRPTMADAPALAHEADDPRVAANLRDGFPHPYSVRDAKRFIARVRDDDPLAALVIVRDGVVVGGLGFHPGVDVYRLGGEIGYWLGVAHWGQGIATEAVSALVERIWRTTPMERLHAGVFAGNPASARVLEKCGFTCESIQRRAIVKNGEVKDLAVWVQLRGEFRVA